MSHQSALFCGIAPTAVRTSPQHSLRKSYQIKRRKERNRMAISVDKVKAIQATTIDLGELIHAINPVTDKEWDAFEKLVSAHKNLMKIDSDALLQLPLPLKAKATPDLKPRSDCPRCQGKGTYTDPTDKSGSQRLCPCKHIDNTTWERVKAEWVAELAPAKA